METYYFADEEYYDDIYDEIEVQCLPEDIVLKLSEKWDCDLMDMMHVASEEELEKYPFLD